MDIVLAAFFLVLLSPLILLAGIGIWLHSPGRIFYRQVRIDLEYIQSMNLWVDLKIMILTPIEMLQGKGGG